MAGEGILVLTGPPCAGKSSVARLLVSDPRGGGRVLVEVDAVFSLLLPESDRNREDRMLAYDAAHAAACSVWRRGRTPVLECTYARHQQRASLVAAVADLPEVPLWVVELFVTPDVAVRRFRGRAQATDLDERLVRERAAAFPYADHALRIESATADPPVQVAQIMAWLESRPPTVDRQAWVDAGIDW